MVVVEPSASIPSLQYFVTRTQLSGGFSILREVIGVDQAAGIERAQITERARTVGAGRCATARRGGRIRLTWR